MTYCLECIDSAQIKLSLTSDCDLTKYIQTSPEHHVLCMYSMLCGVWTLQNLQPCSHSVDCVQSLSLHNEIDNLRIIRRVDMMAGSEHCLCWRKGVAMINRLLMCRHTELAIATNNQPQPTHQYCCYNRADLVVQCRSLGRFAFNYTRRHFVVV